jgi:cytoskeletal protein CcmA (bactofilin family)
MSEFKYIISVAVLFLFSAQLHAHQAGEHVRVTGEIDDDIYLAGGQVDLFATVEGDVVVAGGQLNLEGDVRADVIAAGGDIELRGTVADDARIAGGNVRVLANIGDDLVAAGGRVQTGPTAKIGGSVWVSAGDVFIDGEIKQSLHANGGRVIITGSVDGDVEIWAEHIEIGSTAVIAGNLHYRSPYPATIAQDARVDGKVMHTPVEVPVAPIMAGLLVAAILFLLTLVMTAVVLYLAFPGVAQRCSDSIQKQPWVSLGFGLAVLAGGPLVIVLLFSTGIGALLALLLLAAYLIMLLAGYITGAYYVADAGLRKLNKDNAGKTGRITAIILSLLLLSLINIIPLIGSLLNWLVLIAGMGALKHEMVRAYLASSE